MEDNGKYEDLAGATNEFVNQLGKALEVFQQELNKATEGMTDEEKEVYKQQAGMLNDTVKEVKAKRKELDKKVGQLNQQMKKHYGN